MAGGDGGVVANKGKAGRKGRKCRDAEEVKVIINEISRKLCFCHSGSRNKSRDSTDCSTNFLKRTFQQNATLAFFFLCI